MKPEKKAIYAGSFDPITNGHIDIILRGKKLFEQILVAVLQNPSKQTLFSIQERLNLIREVFKNESRIEVDFFDGLLVDYARRLKKKKKS